MKFFKKLRKRMKPGMIVLTAMLIVAAVIMVIALSLGLSGINTDQIRLYQGYATNDVFSHIDGCAEEGLARLNRSNFYSGGTVTISNTTCTISLTGTDPDRVMTVAATDTNYVKKLQISITIFPTYIVTAWQELTT